MISFGKGASLAALKDDREPWPQHSSVRLLGYRLDAKGTPVFRYAWPGVELGDQIKPEGSGLVREVSWTGNATGLSLRLASAASLESKGANAWRVAGKWNLHLLEPASGQPWVRDSGGAKELLLRLADGEKANRVRYRIEW